MQARLKVTLLWYRPLWGVTKTQTPKTQTSDLRPRKLRPRKLRPRKLRPLKIKKKGRKKKKIRLKCYHLTCSPMVTQCSYATAIGRDIYLVQNSSRHCFSNQFSDLFSDPKTQTSWDLKKRSNSYQFSLPWWSFMNDDHKQQPESRDIYLRWYIASVFPASDSRSQAILSLPRRLKNSEKPTIDV